ncbi:MAG: WG repeat-containing protein [Pyrinomonadaceae bacterium]|nr:WG repeat-containing protein [Pyrinomonadaceae bacterium]
MKSLGVILLTALLSHTSFGCSWDYIIWEPRDKNADALYRFIQDERVGYINQAGNVVIKPTLEQFGNYHGAFRDGVLNLLPWEGPYIDSTGKIVIENTFYRTYGFSEGFAVVIAKDGEKPSYIDKEGKTVIAPGIADSLGDFSEGLASASIENRYGYIDRTGKFVIKPKFLRAEPFTEGFAKAIVGGPCLYSPEGTPCPEAWILPRGTKEENQTRCKYSFINKQGNTISIDSFESAKDFSEGLAAVRLNGKWGFINSKGEYIVKPQFDDAGSFSGGLAPIMVGKKWGYINGLGKTVISPMYSMAETFSDGLALIGGSWNEQTSLYEDYFYIDRTGKRAFDGNFELATSFFKGIAHVKLKTAKKVEEDHTDREGTFAYIKTDGQKVFVYKRKRNDD